MSPRLSIAELNDRFRRNCEGGEVYVTRGIAYLPNVVQSDIFGRVKCFDAFNEDNDPYGERDFGAFDHPEAGKVFWKIDYYDPGMKHGSEDPSDPSKTCRVLAIMLAHEY
jgi:hypothetical protein